MANITYRGTTTTPPTPSSTTAPNLPLTNDQVDGNFKSLNDDIQTRAPLASPVLTGIPTAPTAAAGTNTTQIATTAHVIGERSATATLSNKTLSSPLLSTATADIDAGSIDGTVIGAATPAAGTFTTLGATDDVQINNARYYRSKNATGIATRMLGINASNIAYLGSIDTSDVTQLNVNLSGIDRAIFSSTGLAITGSLSASGASTALNQIANGPNPGHAAARGVLSYSNPYTQMWCYGPDAATIGQFRVELRSADGSVYATPLQVTSTGLSITGALSATGSVGVGTTSPDRQLHVNGIASRFQGDNHFIEFYNSANSVRTGYLQANAGADISLATEGALPIKFWTNGTLRATFDASGNLGLGVTPSAWSYYKAFQFGYTGALSNHVSLNYLRLESNSYNGGGGLTYLQNGYATAYTQNDGVGLHTWFTAPAGIAGNALTFTQAMTLDGNSRLSVTGGIQATDIGNITPGTGAFTALSATGTISTTLTSGVPVVIDMSGGTSGVAPQISYKGNAAQYNWRAGANIINNNAFEVVPSTAIGGSSFITPVASFNTTGLTVNGALSATGNLTLGASGARITGDFSNATLANRVMFQTSTANGNTTISAIPNGTATVGQIAVFNSSDPANSANVAVQANASDVRIASGVSGTGTYLPMTFYAGGSERMRITATGALVTNQSSPAAWVSGSIVSGAGMFGATGAYNTFPANRYWDGSVWRNIATGASQYFQCSPNGFVFVGSANTAAGAIPTDDYGLASLDNDGKFTATGRTNGQITSTGNNGYGSFYARGSSTNNSYMFFGDAGGEKGRITSQTDGTMLFGNGSSATTRLTIDGAGRIRIGSNVTDTRWRSDIYPIQFDWQTAITEYNGNLNLYNNVYESGTAIRAASDGPGIMTEIARDSFRVKTFPYTMTDNVTGYETYFDISSQGALLRGVALGGGLGYGAGAGGTVLQATSKTTSVTLNKPTGQITMNNASLAAGAMVMFMVYNSNVTTRDNVITTINNSLASYRVDACLTGIDGQFYCRLTNITGSTLTEYVTVNFAVIKGTNG